MNGLAAVMGNIHLISQPPHVFATEPAKAHPVTGVPFERSLEFSLAVRLVRHSQRKRGATDRADLRNYGASPRPSRDHTAHVLNLASPFLPLGRLVHFNVSLHSRDRADHRLFRNLEIAANAGIRALKLAAGGTEARLVFVECVG